MGSLILEGFVERLAPHFTGRAEYDVALAAFTTYRLGGPARVFVEPEGPRDLEVLAARLREIGPAEAFPVLALGRGSNLVVSDEGWPGLVVRLGTQWAAIGSASADPATGVVAGAGCPLPQLANWAARRSLAGLEFTIAIPGAVGGAVRMNAGAHGSEIGRVLAAVQVLDLLTGEQEERSVTQLGLGYRSSNLTDGLLVTKARFTLAEGSGAEIRASMDEYRIHRATTQPGAAQNAGSVFVNPPGDSAGRLVEAAGLKGFRVGGAHVSELHANFFIASSGATASDVHALVLEVARRVRDEYGVELHPEIRFAGNFE